MNQLDMQLISKLSFIIFFVTGLCAFFSYIRFNILLGSLSNILCNRRDLLDLNDQYPLRPVIGRAKDDRAMRLVRDYAKSKINTQLPEALVSALHKTYKWYKITILFSILFICAFVLIGVFHT